MADPADAVKRRLEVATVSLRLVSILEVVDPDLRIHFFKALMDVVVRRKAAHHGAVDP